MMKIKIKNINEGFTKPTNIVESTVWLSTIKPIIKKICKLFKIDTESITINRNMHISIDTDLVLSLNKIIDNLTNDELLFLFNTTIIDKVNKFSLYNIKDNKYEYYKLFPKECTGFIIQNCSCKIDIDYLSKTFSLKSPAIALLNNNINISQLINYLNDISTKFNDSAKLFVDDNILNFINFKNTFVPATITLNNPSEIKDFFNFKYLLIELPVSFVRPYNIYIDNSTVEVGSHKEITVCQVPHKFSKSLSLIRYIFNKNKHLSDYKKIIIDELNSNGIDIVNTIKWNSALSSKSGIVHKIKPDIYVVTLFSGDRKTNEERILYNAVLK